jgi:galactitol-specific phosphotransferase system IIC component
MNNLFANLQKLLKSAISIGIQFLCLGVIIQLLLDEKILGWDPIGNIQNAGPTFIGVIAFILLYILFIKKQN